MGRSIEALVFALSNALACTNTVKSFATDNLPDYSSAIRHGLELVLFQRPSFGISQRYLYVHHSLLYASIC